MITELENVVIHATADTPDGRVAFKAPYPLNTLRHITVLSVDGAEIDWPTSGMTLEEVQSDCAKALASESYSMFSRLRDFIEGESCPMDGLQEEEDYDDARPSEQR